MIQLQTFLARADAPIDATQFRKVMRRLPTGVTILTARDGAQIHGMTANSFTSVSLDPLLVLVCIKRHNTTYDFVARTGGFAINILSQAQEHLAKRFAKQAPQPPDPFFDIPYHAATTGAPIFDESVAYLDCRVVATHDAGDHTIFIGEVVALGFGNARDASPLVWIDGHYYALDHTP
ncbi:MAG: flavin reductase [Chloroflexi bacterium]|nr:flavin reductase [Chloroflexota bacterium]